MDRRDSQDLDRVIDEVARAHDERGLPGDLRPAVAARIASAPTWSFAWRAGVASAAVAVVVLAAVVLRSTPEPQRPRTVADAGGERAAVTTVESPGGPTAPAAGQGQVAAGGRMARAVVRQTIDDTPMTEETVDISPVAIVPLEDNEVAAVLAVPQLVQIAPIDVELVSISQLELVE